MTEEQAMVFLDKRAKEFADRVAPEMRRLVGEAISCGAVDDGALKINLDFFESYLRQAVFEGASTAMVMFVEAASAAR